MTENVIETFLQNGGMKIQKVEGTAKPAVVVGASHFRATVNAEAESQITPDGTHFSYRQTVKGGPKKTDVTVPEFLKVRVSPYDGLHVLNGMIADQSKQIPTYDFRAKLSWRMKQSADASKPDFKV